VLAPSLNITSHTRIVVCVPVQQRIYEYYHCNKCTAANSYKNPILQQVTLANQEHTWKRERLQDSIQFTSQESEIYETKPNTKKVPNLHLVFRVEYQFSKYIFLLIGVVPLMGGSWQTSKETTLLSQEIRQTQFCPNELPTLETFS
jgi:hypothetical protein